MAFDPQHTYGYDGGSEMAIPWDVLYGLGPGQVPVDTKIGVVASVCWDPEPDGELGGDSAPSNISATLPEIDNFIEIVVDGDSDGVPDPTNSAGVDDIDVVGGIRILRAYPSPTVSTVNVSFVLGSLNAGDRRHEVRAEVFDITGRLVSTAFDGDLAPGSHTLTWHGNASDDTRAAAGIYFMRITVDSEVAGTAKMIRLR
jgi:hypothetical protein